MNTQARHLIAEYWGCSFEVLNDEAGLRDLVERASVATKCEVLSVSSHAFDPHGVTVMALLSESHASIHTWPEQGYAAVDVYTCGIGNPSAAHEVFVAGLAPSQVSYQVLNRGHALAD